MRKRDEYSAFLGCRNTVFGTVERWLRKGIQGERLVGGLIALTGKTPARFTTALTVFWVGNNVNQWRFCARLPETGRYCFGLLSSTQ